MDSATTDTLPVPPGRHSRSASRPRRSPRREETEDSIEAGRVWSREVEDAWWPCILTLDGGGIRGYSSLLILKALMHEIWVWEQHYNALDMIDRTESPTDIRGRSDTPIHASQEHKSDSVTSNEFTTDVSSESPKDIPEIVTASSGPKKSSSTDSLTRRPISEEELLPCHYFDFMYGTSTGGLIATILGRLRMTVGEALDLYRSVGDNLFGKRRSRVPLMTKYYHEPLEKAVKDIVGSRCHEHENCDGSDPYPWDLDHLDEAFDVDKPRVCQSCCLAAVHDKQITEAYMLRSYPYWTDDAPNFITQYNEGAANVPIWVVTRATTAAPFYFEMVSAEVDGEPMVFKDGGIRENNPSGAAMTEFITLYGNGRKAPNPALLLSVGTGKGNTENDGFSSWPGPSMMGKLFEKLAVIRNLLIKYTEGERQHHQTREHARGEHTWYKRLNVSSGLENMPLDDWRKGPWKNPVTGVESVIPGGASLTHMEEVTDAYLARGFDPDIDSYARPSIMLKQAARKLVLQRRAREALGGPRWDTFVGKHLHAKKQPKTSDVDE